MGAIELMKQVRELAHQNGENMSPKTAFDIVSFLVNTGWVDKDPGSYGDLVIKTETPRIK